MLGRGFFRAAATAKKTMHVKPEVKEAMFNKGLAVGGLLLIGGFNYLIANKNAKANGQKKSDGQDKDILRPPLIK